MILRRRRLRTLASRQGLRTLVGQTLVAFGLLSAIVQLYTAVWGSDALAWRWQTVVLVVAASIAYGIWRAWPLINVSRDFATPGMKVSVVVGDLFERGEHIVVGFSDTFDTDTSGDTVINSRSVQGQLLNRLYGNRIDTLDAELDQASASLGPVSTESRSQKRAGKLTRYPIGSVAVLDARPQKVFAVAYSKMGNNLIAKSSVHDLWMSLGNLWDAVYQAAQRTPVAMPLVGSELARINCLNRESLLKMALLSFVSRSREELVCRELVIVVHPNDAEKINMLEVEAFLRTL